MAARSTPAPVTPPAGKLNLEALWFTYDGLNRVVIHQGALNNGTIELVQSEYGSARQSHQNVYDTAGRLVAQSGLATRLVHRRDGSHEQVKALETRYFVHDLRGNVVAEGKAASLLGTPLVQLPYMEAQNRLAGMDDRTAYFAALRDLLPEATTLRRYDDLGRLVEERELYPAGTEENAIASEAEFNPGDGTHPLRIGGGDAARTKLDISGWLKQASTFSYDADGRMLTQSAFRRDETVQVEWRRTLNGFEEHNTGVKAWVEAAYNEMQRNPDASWQVEQRYQLQTSTLSESTVTNFTSAAPTAARYNWRGRLIEAATSARGYDAAGNLLGYTVQEISGGTVRWTDTYSYEYSVQDGYLETKVTGSSSQQNRRASETLSGYDGWGRRTSLEERTNLKDFNQTLRSARYFAYDAEGGLISRREGELVEEKNRPLQFRQARKEDDKFKNFNPVPHLIEQPAWNALSAGEREYWAGAANTHRYSFANGQLLGSVSEAGRMSVGDRLTGFANSSLGTSTVVVRSGETLRSVAQRIYGDGSLWYVLADANGLTNSDETLAEGQNLQVPQVGTATNSASTFKPFDPSEQIGPTAPSLPTIAPPPKNSCNPVAQLLMVIVSVAVSFVTYGLINPGSTLAAIGAGAASGAAGAAASGVVGSITGVSSFSWRNVAAGAVTGAITAGIAQGIGPVNGEIASVGRLLDAGRPLAAAGMALGNAAAGYIGNKVAGVQGTSFSWRNIAGSAVGSMISSAAFNKLEWNQPGAFEKSGSFGQTLVTGFVGGLVSAHMQKAFGAEVNVNEGRMALDAFGNALGNALNRSIESAHLSRELDRQMDVFQERSRMRTEERMKGLAERSMHRVDAMLDARIEKTANDMMAKTAEKMAARDIPMPSMAPLERMVAVMAAERERQRRADAYWNERTLDHIRAVDQAIALPHERAERHRNYVAMRREEQRRREAPQIAAQQYDRSPDRLMPGEFRTQWSDWQPVPKGGVSQWATLLGLGANAAVSTSGKYQLMSFGQNQYSHLNYVVSEDGHDWYTPVPYFDLLSFGELKAEGAWTGMDTPKVLGASGGIVGRLTLFSGSERIGELNRPGFLGGSEP